MCASLPLSRSSSCLWVGVGVGGWCVGAWVRAASSEKRTSIVSDVSADRAILLEQRLEVIYKALLRICRALLQIYRALLWIYRALLWIYGALNMRHLCKRAPIFVGLFCKRDVLF